MSAALVVGLVLTSAFCVYLGWTATRMAHEAWRVWRRSA